MGKANTISFLIDHEEEAYRIWYQAYLEAKYAQSNVEFTSGKLSIDEIKDFFKDWLAENIDNLRKLVCPTYHKIQNSHKSELEMVVAIADILKSV
jgi:hypothetical protein